MDGNGVPNGLSIVTPAVMFERPASSIQLFSRGSEPVLVWLFDGRYPEKVSGPTIDDDLNIRFVPPPVERSDNPSVVPGEPIGIEGTGPRFAGLYHAPSASHQVPPGDYLLPSTDGHRCDDARVLIPLDLLL